MARTKSTAAALSTATIGSLVAASGQGGVEAVYADKNVWGTRKMLGLLYDVDVRSISDHLKNVFAEPSTCHSEPMIKDSATPAPPGGQFLVYQTQDGNLITETSAATLGFEARLGESFHR